MNKNIFTFRVHSLLVVYWLIVLNVVLYILVSPLSFLFQIDSSVIYDKIQLSQQFATLIEKPWTLISYAFFHANFWHLFFNMLLLYFGGILFLNLFSAKRFLFVYFIGIIIGGMAFVMAYQVFPRLNNMISYLVGASTGIMAILIFISTYTPSYRIYLFGVFTIPLWVLGIGLVLLDLVSIPISNSGGRIAHLGGALYGFLSAYFLKNNILVQRKKLVKRSFVQKRKTNTLSEEEKRKQEQVNIILDKISKSGYESLTNEEKSFLFKVSKSVGKKTDNTTI